MSLRCRSLAALLLLAAAGCKREAREIDSSAQPIAPQPQQLTTVQAGGSGPPPPSSFRYDGNAYAQSQGQQIFEHMNCGTCHASRGGGDIGPPLLDDKWIYGSEPQQIYLSIVEGRPNGMPSYRNKIAEAQLWQLVAFVRSLGSLGSKNAAPGRGDHLNNGLPPNSTAPQKPVHVSNQSP